MQTEPGTGMICDMIRPEGMSRPVGTAMQTEPGTDMICDMIRSDGMSRRSHADHSGHGYEPMRVESYRAAQRCLASVESLRAT